MTNNVTVLFNSYLKLSKSEQEELKKLIKEHDGKGYFEKGQMNESFGDQTRRLMGPTSGFNCPTCGR
jgi:transcription initiation factor IIE alpha subunit